MTGREQSGIASKMNGSIPVFSQSNLGISGRIARGNQVLIHYKGHCPFRAGQVVYLETAEGTFHNLSVVRIGQKGKAYGTIGNEVEPRERRY